jgi:Zn-dependent protease with chaperone function
MNLSELRHGKEKLYRTIALVIGGLIWLGLLLGTVGTILLFLIPVAIVLLIAERVFRVALFGDSVRVSSNQFPEIHAILRQCAGDMGLQQIPQVFVVNSNGIVNAVAIKFLRTRYVMLYSHLVDVMDAKKLGMIIAHELAHHAAGHTNFLINLILKPSYLVPFLGAAYSRACELTADRIAAAWLRDLEASKSALVAIACGSMRLTPRVNVSEFREQEALVPPIIGFLVNLFATHPRTTRRIIEIDEFFRDSLGHAAPVSQAAQ